MADQFSQNEIDELIQSGLSGSSEDMENKAAESGPEEMWTHPSKTRYVRAPKPPEFRFPKMYRSPLVKQENIVFNPDGGSDSAGSENKIVVRTLSNFIDFVQEKKQRAKIKSIDKR